MSLLQELRLRGRHVIGPALGVTAVCYFTYHAVNGERGLVAWHVLQQQVEAARTTLAASQLERQTREERARLLHPQRVDQDMLDEWARKALNFGQADETVILLAPKSEAGQASRAPDQPKR